MTGEIPPSTRKRFPIGKTIAGVIALFVLYALASPFFNGPSRDVKPGMTVNQAFHALGNTSATSILIHEVLKGGKSERARSFSFVTAEDSYRLMEVPGPTLIAQAKSIDEITPQLEKVFHESSDSSWSVFTLHVTSGVSRDTYGFTFGPDLRVVSVGPGASGGP